MSSSENWPSRCGRGRGRSRNKEHQSLVGHSSRNLGAGDSPSVSDPKHVTNDDSAGGTGYTLPRADGQEPAKLDSCDSSKKRKPLSSRTKTKKPEIQVYVPRARRVQQQFDDSTDSNRSGQDDITSIPKSQQKDIMEVKVDPVVDKPVSSRRKHRPEMQRYVPRGKRELNTVMQDNSASALATERECESRSMSTEKLSSRMGLVKKLKIGKNGEEFSSVDQSSEQLNEDLTGHFDYDEKCIGGHLPSTFANIDKDQEMSMEVNEQDIVTSCLDSNISKDTSFSSSFDTSLNTSNCYSISEDSVTEQSMNSELSETSHISVEPGNPSDSSVHSVSDSASNTNSTHSTCDLISHSSHLASKCSETLQWSSKYSKVENSSVSLSDLPDYDLLTNVTVQCTEPVIDSNDQELLNSEENTSPMPCTDKTAKESLKYPDDGGHDSRERTVAISPNVSFVEDIKDLSIVDIYVMSTQSDEHSKDEASLDVLPNSSIPNRGDTTDVSDCVNNLAACSSINSNIPSLYTWTSSTAGATDGPSELGREIHHSTSLPDVVASTIESKYDHSCYPAESKSDTVINVHKSNTSSDRLHLSGAMLTSVALKQLDSVTDLKASSGNETMSSKTDSQSEDEDGWDAMFDDNGDCLDPSIMEELTAHVGNVKIDKPKINYLKFETKDPDVDMEAYNHVIEIYDFPSEFKTGDLIAVFKDFMKRGFDIKWVDDTHALGVFANKIAARDALGTVSPLLKVRQLSEASKQSKLKAKKTAEFLQPYKARPETSAVAARRLVSGALGIQASIPREKRELERQQLKEAKEKRKQARQQKQDIWDGSFGKCAMDEDV